MHSRTIAVATLAALAVLIVVGSLALQLATATAATGPADVAEAAAAFRPAGATPPAAAPATRVTAETAAAVEAEALPREAVADSLQWLLTRIHVLFEPYSADINSEMIPYLADIITVVNQRDDLFYRLEIYEPDAELARRRAQALSDVLRLNVVEPGSIQITGAEGSHATRVHLGT